MYYNSTESPVEVTLFRVYQREIKWADNSKVYGAWREKIVPVSCQRSIVQLRPDKAEQKRTVAKNQRGSGQAK